MDLFDPQIWFSLLTLTFLEIVLGIDNVIFISIVVERLPESERAKARQIGLGAALIMRIILLLCISWIVGLTAPLFHVYSLEVSWRNIILFAGGLFLLAKGTMEIHHMIEGDYHAADIKQAVATFSAIITQIMLLDVVFSLDSIITAVGMAQHLPVMVIAIIIAMVIMLAASGPVSRFISHHPTTKMLALSFLLLVGVALVADGFEFHIPRGYLYFAITFSLFVESMNLLAAKKRKKAKA